ncbi:hypothetical protein [Burkholderia vietnamiensis]|uniref:hypothetical protein n=1 Tax=Burkholderia vietnamiensis TaxID=60552 RepID=UPI001CF37390|nr:hypothetical protein [Burkholderia vietnamiensis]MCA8198911.1 hypothetical protein [Burkholderia vietnamiensis]
MDFSILSSAVDAGNAAFNFVKYAVAARDQAKIEAGTADLEIKMREINQAALRASQDALKAIQDMRAMDKEMAALQRENDELKAKADERKRYALVDIGRQQFAYVLRTNALREIDAEPAPKYYLCQPCMDSDQKVVLQGDGPHGRLKCPRCSLALSPNRATEGPSVVFSESPRFRDY